MRAVWRFTSSTAQLPRIASSASGSTHGESSITARVSTGRGSLIVSKKLTGLQANTARPCAPSAENAGLRK